jgi:hypothetical protein
LRKLVLDDPKEAISSAKGAAFQPMTFEEQRQPLPFFLREPLPFAVSVHFCALS